MRLLPLVLLLAGCFDGATTTIALDVKTGTAHVRQQLHNAWPDEVGCEEKDGVAVSVEACVAGVREYLERSKSALAEGGATIGRAGVVLADGELDLLYEYDAPLGAATLRDQGLSLVWMDERTPAQVAAGKTGKRRAALFAVSTEPNQNVVTVDGRYRRLTGTSAGETWDVWLFRGKEASITSEWTYAPAADAEKSPGPWLREHPGLEDALRASGLVVTAG